MPIIVLFIVYSSVKSNIILQDTDFLSLLMNHKGKFIFYFFVSFIEEVIFRGIIFGLLLPHSDSAVMLRQQRTRSKQRLWL